MRRTSVVVGLAVATLAGVSGISWAAASADGLRTSHLRCEYEEAPLALDTRAPRFSWWLEDARAGEAARGLRQAAYALRVAGRADLLAAGPADLWESGRVESGQSVLVPYAGRPLVSRQVAWWAVRVWDTVGRDSGWSAPARFATGLLEPADWTAQWIGADPVEVAALDGCSWVWQGEPGPGGRYPPGPRYFRRRFQLPGPATPATAVVTMTGDNRFRLLVNGREALSGDAWERLVQADVASLLVPGANVLAVQATNGGDNPNEAGLIGRLRVRLSDGATVDVPVDASWRVADTAPAGWAAAGFDDGAWAPVRVLGPYGCAPWGQVALPSPALPIFRHEFDLAKPVAGATLYVCGLGHYEARLNGQTVGDRVLDPGWTNYRRTCLYSAYDVAAQLRPGRNALGVLLGNGMYNVAGGRYTKFRGSFGEPKLILQLEVDHPDGTTTRVASDGHWRTVPGPITFSCIYGGEDHDARRERPGWDAPGFDGRDWRPARVVDGAGGVLRAQTATPLRVMAELAPVAVTQPRPGVFVYDLGRNCSNRPSLGVRGPTGATLRLTPGELLNADGTVSQRSSGGPSWYAYTCRGDAEGEAWTPRFFYYGSRYYQVEGALSADAPAPPGAPEPPRLLRLSGQFLYNAAPVVGEFQCSDATLNRIHDLILTAVRSNLQSVVTDCPHREKLGWLEVPHLLARGILFNLDATRLLAKVSRDMREAQTENGLVPDIAPEFTVFSGGFRDSPEWGSACAMVPWFVHEMTGDAALLEQQAEVIERYVAYLGGTAKAGIVTHGLGDWYDVGPRGPGASQLTSTGLTATAFYAADLAVLAAAARRLGRTADATRYEGLAAEARKTFNAKFFQPDTNRYDRGSQTALAMPLALDLAPPDRRAAILDNLVAAVRTAGTRVTAGDVGFVFVVRALTDGGRSDVLLDLVRQPAGPGYVDQLRKGATSLTEAWDANPGSSQNHCMLGHAEEWLYTGLAGLRPDPAGPGFARSVVRPGVVGDLAWVKARHDTPYGPLVSEWERTGERLVLRVVVPANTTATVFVPAADSARVGESGRPLAAAPGVRVVGPVAGAVVVEVGAGEYRFEVH